MSSIDSGQSSLAKIAEYVEMLGRDAKSRAFVPLAETYRQAGMLEDALKVAVKGVRANPDYSLGYIALGRILLTQEKTEDASKSFRKAVQLDSESLPALKGLLKTLWLRRDRDGAGKVAERILALDGNDVEARRILSELDTAPIVAETAPASLDEGSAEGPEGEEPIKTATLADIYVKQGLYQKALNLYRQILSHDPDNEEIRRRAAAAQNALSQGIEGHQPGDAVVRAAPAPTAVATASPEDPREALIARMQNWLDLIKQRREHVQ